MKTINEAAKEHSRKLNLSLEARDNVSAIPENVVEQ